MYKSWSKKFYYKKILAELTGMKSKDGSVGSKRANKKSTKYKSPFHDTEVELYMKFIEKRKKSSKVSATWIHITARTLFNDYKELELDKYVCKSFNALYGWTRRFMRRKKINFRKRKCGKERTAEECVSEFEDFLYKVQFEYIQQKEGDGDDGRDALYKQLPPKRCYNMDQVPPPSICQ